MAYIFPGVGTHGVVQLVGVASTAQRNPIPALRSIESESKRKRLCCVRGPAFVGQFRHQREPAARVSVSRQAIGFGKYQLPGVPMSTFGLVSSKRYGIGW